MSGAVARTVSMCGEPSPTRNRYLTCSTPAAGRTVHNGQDRSGRAQPPGGGMRPDAVAWRASHRRTLRHL